jgi:hypothetical protein
MINELTLIVGLLFYMLFFKHINYLFLDLLFIYV